MNSNSDLCVAAALGGLPILGCLAGSPAAEAGARYGDVLLSVDGTPTSTWDEYIAARARCRDRFVARVFRAGEELELSVDLRPSTRSPLDVLGALIEQGVAPTPLLDEPATQH